MQQEQRPRIDEIVALIVAGGNETQVVSTLDQLSIEQLAQVPRETLNVLNPTIHSIGYLYFLNAKCLYATKVNAAEYFTLLNSFVQLFDPAQIASSPRQFKFIGFSLLHLAEVTEEPLLPLQSFVMAIDRYTQGSRVTLTSLHAPFVKACIKAKNYTYPLQFLECDIQIIEKSKHDLKPRDVLEYYYYGAIVYIANKNFDRALEFLTVVISAPTQRVVSAIQIAAYRKFILVSLIYEGRSGALPKCTANHVEKACKTQAGVYQNLAEAFVNTDIQGFRDIATKSSNIFESERNTGLVKQCFQSLLRKKIKQLAYVYITVGLSDMTKRIGVITSEELEKILVEMIIQDEIKATISITNDYEKMVHFEDEEEEETEVRKQMKLEDSIHNITMINERISLMDKLEALNRDFQVKFMTLSSTGPMMSEHFVDEEMDLPVDE
ncbi:uncharacterized protein RHIMIDRAFT_241786 [Rhizopus microsporus ATCC 52813]|uniref:COP9 signalosome complex subunit 3 n=1 Tax=Rhizopus microsporus ATCC 52813 TaxID=1340429 RepID=A0A2G4SHP6_RHIZD|nr:uncharacterized protein RHIMIDRAFT_241786 [Rhizopus microsporus ATCC 52813]PHZ08272.1 hypothetical protein RHIMIDRAFT_241786 [Rhizopus microsporus ATCC 52813]